LGAIKAGELSGTVTVRHKSERRRLLLLRGDPIALRSNAKGDGVGGFLVRVGKIKSSSVRRWMAKDRSSADVLDDREASGDLTAAQARAVWRARLRHGLLGPLHWADGTWEFRRAVGMPGSRIDGVLLPGVNTLRVVQAGVSSHFDEKSALQHARSWDTPLRRGRRYENLMPHLSVPTAVLSAISGGRIPAEVVERSKASAGKVAQLFWLLEQLEVVVPALGADPIDLGAVLAATGRGTPLAPPQDDEPSQGARPSAATMAQMVEGDRKTRMGKDHYRFLGVETADPSERLHDAIRLLEGRWVAAARDDRLTGAIQAQARELLGHLDQVMTDLSTDETRKTYDTSIGIDPMLAAMGLTLEPGDHELLERLSDTSQSQGRS
jgi:hypothetical protein